ncbi:MAG: signal peptidase II [Eggerthellaceae bacterium]|nr:signal peptidase II [Eggerthellaceae bacterium]
MSVKKKAAIFIIFGLSLVVLDQVTKVFVFSIQTSTSLGYCKLIPGFLSLCFVKNTGAAWGIFQDASLALSIFSIVIFAFFIIYNFALNKKAHKLFFSVRC